MSSPPPIHPSAQLRRESFARRAESLVERVRSFNTIIYEVSYKILLWGEMKEAFLFHNVPNVLPKFLNHKKNCIAE